MQETTLSSISDSRKHSILQATIILIIGIVVGILLLVRTLARPNPSYIDAAIWALIVVFLPILVYNIFHNFITTVRLSEDGVKELSYLKKTVKEYRWSELVFCGKILVKANPPGSDTYQFAFSTSAPEKVFSNGAAYRVDPSKTILIECTETNEAIVSAWIQNYYSGENEIIK